MGEICHTVVGIMQSEFVAFWIRCGIYTSNNCHPNGGDAPKPTLSNSWTML